MRSDADRRREWAAALRWIGGRISRIWAGRIDPEVAQYVEVLARQIEAGRYAIPWADGAEPAVPRPDVDAAAPEGRGASTDTPTAQEGAEAVTGPWRVGRKAGRTIYGPTDELIGVMDTPDLAAAVVAAVNHQADLASATDAPSEPAPDLERPAPDGGLMAPQAPTHTAPEPETPPQRCGLVVRPGDTLLVRVHPDIGPEHCTAMRDWLAQRLPDVDVVVIAAEQMAIAERHAAAPDAHGGADTGPGSLAAVEAERYRAEVERARPVVEAARAWREGLRRLELPTDPWPEVARLAAAVDQYGHEPTRTEAES